MSSSCKKLTEQGERNQVTDEFVCEKLSESDEGQATVGGGRICERVNNSITTNNQLVRRRVASIMSNVGSLTRAQHKALR